MKQAHLNDIGNGNVPVAWATASGYAAIVALGIALFWLSNDYPSRMPAGAPWDFSPAIYVTIAVTLLWYLRGLADTPATDRPPAWRIAIFLTGLVLIYAVLQTRFEYWSQHMFFLNRIQHVVMHHLGPLLIAISWPGATIRRGAPTWAQRLMAHRLVAAALRVVQQPFLAAFLFVGLFYFWLIPSVHFRAMLDPFLYAVMNWSMVVDGILFWVLVLDPRPKPPARVSYVVRAVLAMGVMFPQILLGALIAFVPYDLYPYYDLCGRLFPAIGALTDQHYGGVIIWIPPAMMSVIALLLVLNALRLHDESTKGTDDDASALAAMARRWTGR